MKSSINMLPSIGSPDPALTIKVINYLLTILCLNPLVMMGMLTNWGSTEDMMSRYAEIAGIKN